MTGSKVSVIVPIYNSESFLSRCIDSILAQSHGDIELLLIDDGSTDGSLKICNEYASADSRILVFHQENRGVSAARNRGLDSMSGDYFTFVDSDDVLKPDAVEFMLKDISAYSADMASAVKNIVLPDGTVKGVDDNHSLNVYSGTDMLALSLDGDSQTNSACAKLYKRSVFDNVRFEEGRSINEDGFFLFQCFALKPTVVQHNECIYLYYYRDGSNSRDLFSEKHLDMLYFCERKKDIIRKDYPELTDRLINMEVRTRLSFLSVLCRTNEKKYNDIQRECVSVIKRHFRDVPYINPQQRRLARITAHGLYPLYRRAVYMKYYR